MHFSNSAEIFRESIREKLKAIKKDVAPKHLLAFKGAAKKKISSILSKFFLREKVCFIIYYCIRRVEQSRAKGNQD